MRPNSLWTVMRINFYAFLLAALLHTASSRDAAMGDGKSGVEDARRFLTKRSVRVCGVKLVEMMKKVCNHCYKTRRPDTRLNQVAKRNTDESSIRSVVAILEANDSAGGRHIADDHTIERVKGGLDALDAFIEKRWGSDGRLPRQQTGGGIANKCCLNQCTYSDLVSYCCISATA